MAVQKFKTFQEAREALWTFKPDAAYYESLQSFWLAIDRLQPIKKYPQGVFKYRTMEEADQAMKDWLLQL